jgi:hypothetical protein
MSCCWRHRSGGAQLQRSAPFESVKKRRQQQLWLVVS